MDREKERKGREGKGRREEGGKKGRRKDRRHIGRQEGRRSRKKKRRRRRRRRKRRKSRKKRTKGRGGKYNKNSTREHQYWKTFYTSFPFIQQLSAPHKASSISLCRNVPPSTPRQRERERKTHTHTYTYIYIQTYIGRDTDTDIQHQVTGVKHNSGRRAVGGMEKCKVLFVWDEE